MQWLWDVGYLVVGLTILTFSGDLLVTGAGKLARQFGIPALVVGLTVVAFGTSAPEVAVSILAGLRGEDDIAIGNVLGSNIANLLLILAIGALIMPLNVALNLARIDAPIMFVLSVVALVFGWTGGEISRGEGIALALGLIGYVILTVRVAKSEPKIVEEEFEESLGKRRPTPLLLALIAIGVAGLAGGAQLMVQGASDLAAMFGVSKAVIGVTIVAVGTSLPELAATISAARHGQPDIAVGNVVGSNIFNVLSVLGISATLNPLTFNPAFLRFDGVVMIAATVLVLPLLLKRRVARWHGALLLSAYAAYLAVLVVQTVRAPTDL